MYGKIKEAYEKSWEEIKNFFGNIRKQEIVIKAVSRIKKAIKKGHEKSSWVNIAALITNILGFAAYCVVSPVIAEYQREKGIRNFSMVAIVVIIGIIIWELVCLTGYGRLKALVKFLRKAGGRCRSFCQTYFDPIMKVIGFFYAIFIILIVLAARLLGRFLCDLQAMFNNLAEEHPRRVKWMPLLLVAMVSSCMYFIPEVTYCSSVVEIYGMPTKLGEELKDRKEMDQCAAYWKIEDYSWRNFMVLTYVEPYGQLDIMKENSTVYGMAFFQPTARIEIHYTKDKGKYLSLNQSAFEVAQANGFREPVDISYYGSNGKLILKLEKNECGTFDIKRYSAADKPQLLNSTLLYIQNEEMIEDRMTSQQIEVTYNSEGLPETRRLSPYIYNANGVNGEYYVYDKDKRLTQLYYLDINGQFVCNKQGIMMVDFQYEDNGNLHSIRYYGGEDRDKKTEGYREVFCERFSYDAYGNLKERSQRDRNENLRSDINGVCIYRYEYDYDAHSALVKEEFLGFDGEPVRDNRFYSTSVQFAMSSGVSNTGRELIVSVDEIGSESSMSNSSVAVENPEDSQRTGQEEDWKQDGGESQAVSEENDDLLQAGHTDFTEQENASPNESTGVLQTIAMSDGSAHMLQTGRQFWQVKPALQDRQEDEPANGSESKDNAGVLLEEEADIIRNYTAIHYVIRKDGCISEKRYCNSEGEPVACERGYAIIAYGYDSLKRITDRQYFINDDIKYCVNGDYASVRNNYDSDLNDNIKSIEYLDANGELVKNKELGYAYVEYTRTYEDQNEIICKKYFDADKQPVRLPKLGYAMVEEYYDNRNFLISEAYYDEGVTPNKTCRTDYGVAEIWYEYEDSGNKIRELYKDVGGNLVNRSDTGYAAVYWKYEGGKKIDCHYERSQEQILRAAVDRNTGIAGIKYTYESGKVVREEYYGIDGMPSYRTDIGCAAMAFEYNDRGKKCTESYYGIDGEAVERKDTGYAMVAYQDNEYGQRISVRYYGADKQLVISAQDHCAGYNYAYDSRGNREYVKYIGLDGGLMTRRDLGYAQVRYTYDSDGNITEGRYLDTEGEPAVRKEGGYTYYTNDYDDNGNWTESCYYIGENTPVLRWDTGYFKVVNEYYDDGRRESQKFYGTDGKQLVISTEYCCAGFEYEYEYEYDNEFGFVYDNDEMGVKKTTTYIGTDGEPMVRRDLGYAKVVSVYDVEDKEVSAVYYDADGDVTVRKDGGYAAFRDKYENGKWVEGRCYGIDGLLTLRSDTGYAVIRNEYDEYGQRIRESYYDGNDSPIISTKYQCASFVYGYDESGNKTWVKYLDTDNEIMVRRDLGYAQMTIGYDHVGNKISESYFDVKGNPAVWKEGGYASYIDEYDNVKWMETRYYDRQGRLIARNDKGYAIIKNEYDAYGQRIAQTYYDASDRLQPVIHKEYYCAGFQYEYDDKGNQVHIGYLGLDGDLMVRRDLGYAQVEKVYDNVGNKIEEAYLDIWNNPAVDKEGGYSYYLNYYGDKEDDNYGRLIKVEYYVDRNVRNRIVFDGDKERVKEEEKESADDIGKEGELVLRKDTGYAIVEYVYDEFGQEKNVLYCGIDREPVISTKYLCAGFEYAYDAKGNKTDIYYLGLEHERIVRRDLGVAHIQKEYDDIGNLVKESYYNNDGPAVYKNYGYAAYEQSFQNGKVVEIKYLDENGDPVINSEEGCAIIRYQYDEFWQCASALFYKTDGGPLVVSNKYYCAGFLYEYDEMGNRTDRRYVDTEGNNMIRRDLGYAHVHSEYDECGNNTGASYYDTDENLTTWKDGGNTYCEFIYDRGYCVEWRYFDDKGNLRLRNDTGYAVIRFEYDVYGQCTGEAYYDTEGKTVIRTDNQCAGRQFGYDERGNQTEFRYIGLDGNPMIREERGYAQTECKFDKYNNKIEEVYLDAEGQPVVRQELGYAMTQWEYNESGKMSKEAYFDENGQAVARNDGGYAYCNLNYYDEGRREERFYYDAEGNLILRNDEGYAIIQYFYDELGQCTNIKYWKSEEERVVNTQSGCAGIEYEYDERGNITCTRYYNEDGEAVDCKGTGIAMEETGYNEYGYVIERAYYAVDPEDEGYMKLQIHKELGYASVKYIYDGNSWVRTEYYDEEGDYIEPEGIGYAVYEREYNDMWQTDKESYYDRNEDLLNYVDGRAAVVEYTYDPRGNVTERIYYNSELELLED